MCLKRAHACELSCRPSACVHSTRQAFFTRQHVFHAALILLLKLLLLLLILLILQQLLTNPTTVSAAVAAAAAAAMIISCAQSLRVTRHTHSQKTPTSEMFPCAHQVKYSHLFACLCQGPGNCRYNYSTPPEGVVFSRMFRYVHCFPRLVHHCIIIKICTKTIM